MLVQINSIELRQRSNQYLREIIGFHVLQIFQSIHFHQIHSRIKCETNNTFIPHTKNTSSDENCFNQTYHYNLIMSSNAERPSFCRQFLGMKPDPSSLPTNNPHMKGLSFNPELPFINKICPYSTGRSFSFLASVCSSTSFSVLGKNTVATPEEFAIFTVASTYLFHNRRQPDCTNHSKDTKRIKLMNANEGSGSISVMDDTDIIFRGNCSNLNCSCKYIYIRGRNKVAIYASTSGHCHKCKPTKSDLPIGILISSLLYFTSQTQDGKKIAAGNKLLSDITSNADWTNDVNTILPEKYNNLLDEKKKKLLQTKINKYVTKTISSIKKKIEEYKKKHDNNDSEASFQKFLSNHKYTVQEFAELDPEKVLLNPTEFKDIVVLRTDTRDIEGGKRDFTIMTTKGKIHLFHQLIEMSKCHERITIEVDCSGEDGNCLIAVGFSDYALTYRNLIWGILREECKSGAAAALTCVRDILVLLKVDLALVQLRCLKDGGVAFVGPCNDLSIKQFACTVHIGKYSGQPKNGRGSLAKYMIQKRYRQKNRQQSGSLTGHLIGCLD